MDSDVSQNSDNEDQIDFDEKIRKLEIQELQVPHQICQNKCNSFHVLSKIERSDYGNIKKAPQYQLSINEAVHLLKYRLNIKSKIRNLKNNINKKKIEKIPESNNIRLIQKAVLNLFNNIYSKYIAKYITGLHRNNSLLDKLNSHKMVIQVCRIQDTKTLCLQQFRKLLKQHLNLVYKKPPIFYQPIQKQIQQQEQQNYLLALLSLKKRFTNIIYLDETIINSKLKQKRYWYFKNKSIRKCQKKISKNISILGAMGDNQFFCFQLQKGNNNSASFGTFLNRVIKQAKIHFMQQHFLLVLDNSPIHHSNFFKDNYLMKVNHLYLHRYSPQFNLIELIRKQLKQNLVEQDIFDESQIPTLIHHCIYQIWHAKTQKYIDHSIRVALDFFQR